MPALFNWPCFCFKNSDFYAISNITNFNMLKCLSFLLIFLIVLILFKNDVLLYE